MDNVETPARQRGFSGKVSGTENCCLMRKLEDKVKLKRLEESCF